MNQEQNKNLDSTKPINQCPKAFKKLGTNQRFI
jgi:hypothetical protein